MTADRKMTVAKLIAQLRRFPRGAEVVELDVSVLVDAGTNLVQSLSLWEDDDDGDDPDDPEREDLPTDERRAGKVVDLKPRRTTT